MIRIEIRRLVRAVFQSSILLPLLSAAAGAQQNLSRSSGISTDLGVTYTAQRSLRAATDQNFWMQGASGEFGMAIWHGLGPAVNITGTTTSSIGSSDVPLSLITFAAGPRLRLRQKSRWSPYGEALFGVARGFDSTFPSVNSSRSSSTSFALQAGGGLDVHLREDLFLRALHVVYVRTQLPNATNNIQNMLQIGVGAGFTFGPR